MREYIGNVLSVLVIISMIPGCFSKQNKISKAALPQKQAAFSFDGLETNIDCAAGMADQTAYNPEIQAKLYDIPTMVGSVSIELEKTIHPDLVEGLLEEGQIMLGFLCQYDQEMVANFYNFEMENVGWQRIACIKGFETILVFQKPKKICIISIRSLSSKHKNNYACLVHICTSNKEK
jgi:hypothetical protein